MSPGSSWCSLSLRRRPWVSPMPSPPYPPSYGPSLVVRATNLHWVSVGERKVGFRIWEQGDLTVKKKKSVVESDKNLWKGFSSRLVSRHLLLPDPRTFSKIP